MSKQVIMNQVQHFKMRAARFGASSLSLLGSKFQEFSDKLSHFGQNEQNCSFNKAQQDKCSSDQKMNMQNVQNHVHKQQHKHH